MIALSPPLRAALYMTLCCAFVALSTFLAKALGRGIGEEWGGEPMHPFEIVLGRYGFALLALSVLMLWRRQGLSGAPWGLYAGRSVFGWAGVTGLFAAAAMIPLADATAISFLNPVFAMILAILFLGERVGKVRWAAAAVALAGGALLIRPGSGATEPGALIALAAALFMAVEIIFAKLLARREGVLRMLFCTNLLGAAVALLAAAFVWRLPSAAELVMMALVGWTMVTAQALFMATLKVTDASFATPFFYATLVFAALYDALWFGTIPTALSFAGAGLIVAGAVLLALRDAKAGAARAPEPLPPPETVTKA
ncbi:MAG: DMT family transporter [Pikeienuella sp.]|uniref:DMT family transporter n=1 Tax=Pikeienuella sp. TaxID=2831957 RepID=UPI0039198717